MTHPVLRTSGLAAAIATLAIAGCGGEDPGTSILSLSLTDAPVHDADVVWLEFTGIEIKPANGASQTIMFDTPKGFDMLLLQNGNAAPLLGDTTVDAGEYNWIRLLLDTEPGASYVEVDGVQHNIRIPSGAQTGLKLVRGFTMPAGGRADFTIDFVLAKSIIAPPGQSPDYLMKPVLRMTNNVETGTLEGSFSAPTLAGIAACAGKAPEVYLYEGAGVIPDDLYNPNNGTSDSDPAVDPLLTATAFLDGGPTYQYQIGFVEAGTYTVTFTCDVDDPVVDENATTPLVFGTPQTVVVTAGQTTTANF